MDFFEVYEKYVKPQMEPAVIEEDPDKLFEVEEDSDEPKDEPGAVMPNIDELKASLMAELKEQLLKELAGDKAKEVN